MSITKGVWCSLITPFKENLEVDWNAAREYVARLNQYNFAGFLVGGSVGEGLLLSVQEVQKYVDLVRAISTKPIMVGVIDFNFERASLKCKIDADSILATTCIYFKQHAQATIEYFKAISKAIGKKDLVLYNNSGRVGVNLNHDIYSSLYEIENIVGVKECDSDKFDEYSNKFTNWGWFTGNDDYLVDKFFLNGPASGIISTICSIAPQLAIDCWENKNEDQCEEWLKLCNHAYSIPNPLAVKQMLAKWGIIKPFVRAQFNPLPSFDCEYEAI
jgi:4-hydroxy-tetrahydrodipicolinate synthase